MSRKVSTERGFSAVEAIVIVLVIAVIGVAGWLVWQHHHQKKAATSSSTSTQTSKQSSGTQTADPYAGWSQTCDPALKACYKYPSDWVKSQYGGWQNSADTAYFNYQNPDTKDQAASNVYIASIDDLANANQGLKIIGTVDGDTPGYVVYDASVVAAKNLAVGQTVQLITANPTFSGKSGTDNVTFSATPGANGIAAITTVDQAKAWFSTPEAKQCLRILQSFYYQ